MTFSEVQKSFGKHYIDLFVKFIVCLDDKFDHNYRDSAVNIACFNWD